MNPILIIIQREYLSRVSKKSFLVTTFLVPILMAGLIALMVFMATKGEKKQPIALLDNHGYFSQNLDTLHETYPIKRVTRVGTESRQEILEKNQCDILIDVKSNAQGLPDSIDLYQEGGVSLAAKEFIDQKLGDVHRVRLLEDAGIRESRIDSIEASSLNLRSFDLKNNQETHSELATAIGYVMGFLIYLVILIYGMSVMRGVTEEKTNRIAEVLVSSVKPFHLMMGKIIGIGLVGLTQFLLWILFTGMLQFALPLFIPGLGDSIQSTGMPEVQQAMQQVPQNRMATFMQILNEQNWLLILGCFGFYFLGGYFLYAAMFAAVGSVVNEDPQEAQQMTLPVTMPIIFGFIIMASTIKDPNSALSVFGSMFPLTSPIVMMARIPYHIPGWQIAVSMILLILGFLALTWLSARIYRTGMLMYGKKPGWKEILKWIRYR